MHFNGWEMDLLHSFTVSMQAAAAVVQVTQQRCFFLTLDEKQWKQFDLLLYNDSPYLNLQHFQKLLVLELKCVHSPVLKVVCAVFFFFLL